MTAVIGSSGSGKTTLINFIAGRFGTFAQFEYKGKYLLNDVPIKNINQYKNLIGYVN